MHYHLPQPSITSIILERIFSKRQKNKKQNKKQKIKDLERMTLEIIVYRSKKLIGFFKKRKEHIRKNSLIFVYFFC